MLVDTLFYAFVIYIIYELVRAWLIVNEIKSSVAETVSILEEQSKFRMISFEQVEQNGYNVILCYDNENNFIAQGATKDEVVEIARQRYPNQNLATYKTEELQWIKPESEKNSTNG
jgi:RecB family endonuclease NucS